jgi:hypothetical protein
MSPRSPQFQNRSCGESTLPDGASNPPASGGRTAGWPGSRQTEDCRTAHWRTRTIPDLPHAPADGPLETAAHPTRNRAPRRAGRVRQRDLRQSSGTSDRQKIRPPGSWGHGHLGNSWVWGVVWGIRAYHVIVSLRRPVKNTPYQLPKNRYLPQEILLGFIAL